MLTADDLPLTCTRERCSPHTDLAVTAYYTPLPQAKNPAPTRASGVVKPVVSGTHGPTTTPLLSSVPRGREKPTDKNDFRVCVEGQNQ